MKKLICYELNEVPWRVIDSFIDHKPDCYLSKFMENSAQLTSHTTDSGTLHPWSTWPTVHRGVNNDTHNIRFLNQDLSSSEQWPPIWEILCNNSIDCGVFGSLQSYPPTQHSSMLFHIPDTFASAPDTHPRRYQAFQKFNLRQAGANKATASKISLTDYTDALELITSGIKPSSFFKVALHLANEKRNGYYQARRPLLQPILAFDLFMKCLNTSKPDFATFFSNHVAGMMHRYWKQTFPDDFKHENSSAKDKFHSNSVMEALDIFDKQLSQLHKFAKSNGYEIVIASSMGQEAIQRSEYTPELVLKKIDKLKSAVNVDFDVSQNPAMQPDLTFQFDNEANLEKFKKKLLELTDTDGQQILKENYEPVGNTLTMAIRPSKTVASNSQLRFGTQILPVDDFGFQLITRDIGTAYHQPNGIIIWENFEKTSKSREIVDSRSFAPSILDHFGLEAESYMMPSMQKELGSDIGDKHR